MDSSEFGGRLRAAREAKGLTQLEAGRLLGISNANISAYELGKRQPDFATLVRFAQLYRCRVDYLLGLTDDPKEVPFIPAFSGGPGTEMQFSNDPQDRTPNQKSPAQRIEETEQSDRHVSLPPHYKQAKGVKATETVELITIPILGHIKCGIPLLSGENIIGYTKAPPEIGRKADFALIASGDSMVGAGVYEGDTVFLRKVERGAPGHGDIVAALVDESETTLKYYMKRHGHWYLEPANPAYDPIPADERVQVQGVYVGLTTTQHRPVPPALEDLDEADLINRLAEKYQMDADALERMFQAAKALKGK